MASDSAVSSTEFKTTLLMAVLLGALAFVLFAPAIRYDFVSYDDDVYVYENPQVSKGLSPAGIAYAFTSRENGTWAPLTWLSYEFDTTFLGARASSHHLVNILLHAAAGMLLFIALHLMTRLLWVSTVVAAVFLLHPLRTESVVWIAERKDVLCAFFWMAGLLAYWHYSRKPGVARWALVFLCFLAGLLSKMMIVTFPFVLLLLDFWPLNRLKAGDGAIRSRLRPLVLEKLPFFTAGLLAMFITSIALKEHGGFYSSQTEHPAIVPQVLDNYVFYLGKIFWPTGLSVLYPIQKIPWWKTALNGVGLIAITAICLRPVRTRPWLAVGWLWFVGSLVPVIGFVPFGNTTVADRYSYIPSIGLTLALAAAVDQWVSRRRWAGGLAALGLGVACGLAVRADLGRWRNSLQLYDAALRTGPHVIAYNNRGVVLLKAHDAPAALADFNAAIQLDPGFDRAYCNRGSLLSDAGHYEEAIRDFNKAIECNPRSGDAYDNRGNAYARMGRPADALPDYQRCLELQPDKAACYNNRAAAYFDLKRFAEAMADVKTCQRLGGHPHPGLVEALTRALEQKP